VLRATSTYQQRQQHLDLLSWAHPQMGYPMISRDHRLDFYSVSRNQVCAQKEILIVYRIAKTELWALVRFGRSANALRIVFLYHP
jgi:hypothetical protein